MDAANIVDVVSEYVTLRRSGASYKGLCPFHDDKTPSFYVNPARGICKCFSCGKGGNVVHFIMEQEQLTYYEALRFLAKRYGIEVKEREYTDAERRSQSERESMFAVNEWASRYFHRIMLEHADGRAVGLAYFRSRGFRDDIIEKFRLGFCLDTWDDMSKTAVREKYQPEYLARTGLSIRRDNGTLIDKYRGRVIFPWFNVSGKIVAFGGRKLDARTKGVEQKYINSPQSDIFDKSHELYGIFQAKKQIVKDDLVYMVEGYTDVISMHQCGIENVVANSGTALNDAQIRLLRRFTSNITLLYDGDEAGIHAALRGTDMLLAAGMNVKVLLLPDGDDPDSFSRKHNATEFRQYVEQHQTDFILFKVGLLISEAGRDPLKRSQLANGILDSIKVIPDEILRSTYLHECSELMHMDEQMLNRQCAKLRRAYLDQRKQEREREQLRQQRLTPEQNALTLPTVADMPPAVPEDSSDTPHVSPDELTKILGDGVPAGGSVQPLQEEGFDPTGLTPPDDAQPSAHPVEEAALRPSAPSPSPDAVSPLTAQASDVLTGIERLMMTLVVRYGEQIIQVAGVDGQNVDKTVADYVASELEADQLTFRSPLYAQMLADVRQHTGDDGFRASRFFQSSPNLDISREASDLLSDRYQLSVGQQMMSEQDMVPEYIVHLLMDYKFQIVREDIKRVTKQLNDPAVLANPDQLSQLLQQHIRLSAVMRQFAERLGERVVQ